uniref:Uncharacterized protein n=2 Tax=Meloidogyne TaxID=189290 RepID=A0A6V7UPK3_MELEN|nr:unnamed protein product [Meloidogyne enterolobii]
MKGWAGTQLNCSVFFNKNALDLLDILFKFDYFVCLLLGYPLNIILIILIIFKNTKRNGNTQQNSDTKLCFGYFNVDLSIINSSCIKFYIIDTEGNEFMIFPYGILLSFMNENFNPIICNIVFVFWQYIGTINMRGLCVQFIYRYLVLNRSMEINFCRYLLMFSTVLVVQLLLSLNLSGLYMTYNVGGIKYFDDFNKTWPYIQYKIQKMNGLTLLPTIGVTIVIYLIMIICAFKMIRFVNLNTNFDGNLKRLNKLLTKVLILLVRRFSINILGTFLLSEHIFIFPLFS